MKVFKFGGASVKDASSVRNVAQILHNYKEESLVIIVSAMGKTTNALEGVVNAYYYKSGDPFALLETVKQQHYSIAKELFGEDRRIFDTITIPL